MDFPHPYYSGGPGEGWWFLFWLVPLLYAVLVGGVAVLAVRYWRQRGPRASEPHDEAEAILSGRFARGEIDLQDYQERLAALRDARRP
ncbi:MAG TPA: hypothetical protein VMU75_14180 [Acidimicrobiales bacterium]|nr:hypothetical protein [Acidimicrobiales bacterium]